MENEDPASGGAAEGVPELPPAPSMQDHLNAINAFFAEMGDLKRQADRVFIFTPWIGFPRLAALNRKRLALTDRFDEALSHADAIPNSPFQTAAFAVPLLMANRTSQSISNSVRIRLIWSDLGSVLDWKLSFCLATISLYVSLFSLVLSVIGIWLSLRAPTPAP